MPLASEVQICAALAQSPLFDSSWYLAKNPDVGGSNLDPVLHYVRHGEREGRNPSPGFDLRCHWPGQDSSGNLLYDYIVWRRRDPEPGKLVPIVFAVNDNYAPYLSVTLASLAYTASPDRDYVAYILYNQLSERNLRILSSQDTPNLWIEPLDVSGQVQDILARAFISAHGSHETYFRILIPQMLPHYKKCLYLDCDLVVNRDVGELYDYDVSDVFLGAIEENWEAPGFEAQKRKFTPFVTNYFNCGVMVINVEKFIAHDLFSPFMQRVRSGVKYPCWDQDILNILCSGKARLLPMTWNCMWHLFVQNGFRYSSKKVFLEFVDCALDPAIVHYNAPEKPWQLDDGHFAAMFWRHARRSPFYDEIRTTAPYDVEKALARAERMREDA